jgi:hypothetical protein
LIGGGGPTGGWRDQRGGGGDKRSIGGSGGPTGGWRDQCGGGGNCCRSAAAAVCADILGRRHFMGANILM